jgi:hypothetical protein
MTNSTDQALTAVLRATAHRSASCLLDEALEDARAEVKSVLRRRLVDALLAEIVHGAGVAADQTSDALSKEDEHSDTAGDAGARRRYRDTSATNCDPENASEMPVLQRGLYLYGFSSAPAHRFSGLIGIDQSATYPLVAGDLVAIVSDVSGQQHRWGVGPDGEPDLTLLAPRLEEHERVLEAILELDTVLPTRFGTLYASADAVSEVLRAQSDAIRGVLQQLNGKVEWGLTISWVNRSASGGTGDGGHALRAPGRAYLTRREAEMSEAKRLAEQRSEVAAEVHQSIDAAASASVVHPLASRNHDDDGAETLLRSSYLVDRDGRTRFEAVIAETLEARAGLNLRGVLTGPWPPYSFSNLTLAGTSS